MKKIFGIYLTDLNNIRKNWVALIIVIGLICLPSMYAWVNILACWNPYGNTKGIKISVVNYDKGGVLKDVHVNVGENVVEALKENEDMGWEFGKTKEQAISDLENGLCYAAIIIPEDFSEKILTFIDKDPVKPTIEYIENDKLNAIAPKITDKGASAIQQNINQKFIEQISGEAFKNLNVIGEDLKDNYGKIMMAQESLFQLDERFPELIKSAENITNRASADSRKEKELQEFIPLIKNSLDSILHLSESSAGALEQAKANLRSSAEMIGANIDMVDSLLEVTIISSSNLTEKLYEAGGMQELQVGGVITNLRDAREELTNLQEIVGRTQQAIKEKAVGDENIKKLQDYLDQINNLLTLLKDNTQTAEQSKRAVEQLIALTNDVKPLIETVNNVLFADVFPMLDEAIVLCEDLNYDLEQLYEQDRPKFIESVDRQLTALDKQKNALNSIIVFLDGARIMKPVRLISELNKMTDMINGLEQELGQMKSLEDAAMVEQALLRQRNRLIDLKIANMNIKNQISDFFLPDMENLAKDMDVLKQGLADFTGDGSVYNIEQIVDGSIDSLGTIEGMLSSYSELLKKLAGHDGDQIILNADSKVDSMLGTLKDYETGLNNLKANIGSDAGDAAGTLRQLGELSSELSRNLKRIKNDYNTNILPRVDNLIKNSIDANDDVEVLVESVNNGLHGLYSIMNQNYASEQEMLAAISQEINKLPEIADEVHSLVLKIKETEDNYDIVEMMDIFMNSMEKERNFLSSPTEIQTTRLNAIPNYGSAMTPFYTVLSLWVGCLLLCSLFTTGVHGGDYGPHEIFLGKFLLFITLAICQALVVTIGDFALLGCYAVDPAMVVAIGVFSSMVFCCIVYSLVSVFGNIGKAVGVVLLVLQISASGGTFPSVLTPPFFQKINPFLPFTYAIDAMRQATAGISLVALTRDLGILLVFGITAFTIGFLIKEPLYELSESVQKKFEEAGIGE